MDNLASLPGDVFDKAEAWEKLHQRLSVKKKTKKVGAYWMAAAVAASFIAFFVFKSTEEARPGSDSTTKQEAKKKIEVKTEKLGVNTELTQRPVEQSQPLQPKGIVQKGKASASLEQEKSSAIVDTVIATAPHPLENMAPSIDSLTESIAFRPVKRKLRVVHINELDEPEENKDHFVRVERIMRDRRVLSGGSLSNNILNTNSGDDILKIKLSSNN